jgi:hypothetical protein
MNINKHVERILLVPVSLALAFALVTGAAGCMVSVDAEIPRVEVTQRDLLFAGVPVAGALGEVSMTRSFSESHQALDLPAGLTSEVKALDVSLTAKQGISDFSFVRNLRLTMSDESDGADAIELINYERDIAAPASLVLTMVSANPVNTLEKWKTKSALFTIDIAGTLPDTDWSVDVTVRFAGSIHYQR